MCRRIDFSQIGEFLNNQNASSISCIRALIQVLPAFKRVAKIYALPVRHHSTTSSASMCRIRNGGSEPSMYVIGLAAAALALLCALNTNAPGICDSGESGRNAFAHSLPIHGVLSACVLFNYAIILRSIIPHSIQCVIIHIGENEFDPYFFHKVKGGAYIAQF